MSGVADKVLGTTRKEVNSCGDDDVREFMVTLKNGPRCLVDSLELPLLHGYCGHSAILSIIQLVPIDIDQRWCQPLGKRFWWSIYSGIERTQSGHGSLATPITVVIYWANFFL